MPANAPRIVPTPQAALVTPNTASVPYTCRDTDGPSTKNGASATRIATENAVIVAHTQTRSRTAVQPCSRSASTEPAGVAIPR